MGLTTDDTKIKQLLADMNDTAGRGSALGPIEKHDFVADTIFLEDTDNDGIYAMSRKTGRQGEYVSWSLASTARRPTEQQIQTVFETLSSEAKRLWGEDIILSFVFSSFCPWIKEFPDLTIVDDVVLVVNNVLGPGSMVKIDPAQDLFIEHEGNKQHVGLIFAHTVNLINWEPPR